jgi:uncharacterized protein
MITTRIVSDQRIDERTPRHRSPWIFFALTLILAAPFWLIGAITAQSLPQGLGMNLPISSLMVVSPISAAIILVYREEKRAGVKRFLKSVFDLKRITPAIWYVPIIFLMPLITLLSYGIMRFIGIPLPDLHIPWLMIPILFALYFIAAVGEETGWMGYAIDPLQGRWNALGASIILGSVWAIWHIPAFVQAHDTPTWIAEQCLLLVATRVLIVWVYNNAGKSILAAIIIHDLMNVSDALSPNYSSPYAPVIVGGVTAILAVIVTFLWGAKTLARFRYPRKKGKNR